MKKIFYKKILCKIMHSKISLIILLIFCCIPKPSFGMSDEQLEEILDQITHNKNNVGNDKSSSFAFQTAYAVLETLIQDKMPDVEHGKDTDVNIDIDMDIQDNDICDGKIRSFEPDEKLSSFYSEYIAKYYPKAYVIRKKFLDMTAEQVAEALNDIVHVFTKEPWFYFQNSPKGFRLIYYWEYVLDQCGIIHDFLKHAKVDSKTKKITYENGFAWDDFAGYFNYQEDVLAAKTQTLLSYLQKNHLNSYTAFFALSFDYQVKFFNEGILLKNLNIANKYFSEIEYNLEKLRSTPKEADYYETTKTCKELLGILKKKLGIDNLNNLGKSSAEGTSDASNYYKEFTELNDVV
ncbi:MAG: hypothetical protein V1646_01290 [bacterium]